ncbi:membrane-associated phospholipid phosphatase [Caldalkalibacillus uzonensis]|uniref:Membrane-associated phospholipid phosphatase n=1 Tax=Caldalkalibacillus uzonensis TaxID=353224 RepID=A0ABU0CPU1_9BACI|nr:phosphatase PAP2 family protein [Caldalkalibacillus uzonensis]MDQ0337909.1 membrane-associated phospholipid phosphatase [Caldalkalibacillus uzonensis]
MTQIDFLIWVTSWQNPILNALAAVFTFMGDEEFYFLVLPFVYWCFSKAIGFRLAYIFLVSIYVNAFVKINTGLPRPVGVEGINSIFVSSAEVGSHYPYDSFPSGHAQGSTTLWGYLAYVVNKPWFWVVSVVLIFCISYTRLYAGLHWPLDVVAGILIGIIVLVVGIRISQAVSQVPSWLQWLLAFGFPLLLLVLFRESEGVKYSGFLFGAGVAYLLELRYVQMNLRTAVWKKAIAFLIGMDGIIALQTGLKIILPTYLMSDFLRYAVVGIWGIGLAPWVFVKVGLYPTDLDLGTPPGHKTAEA